MTVSEVAAALGVSDLQVRSEHARGVLPARRVSGRFLRFTEDDVTTYLARIADDGSRARSRD